MTQSMTQSMSQSWKRSWSKLGFFAVLALLLAAPLHAGIYFESVTTDDQTRDSIRVKSWVEGPKARIEFEEGIEKSMMPKGSYLITTDGGRTIYLVNPKEETYGVWDLEAMLQTLGQVMEAAGPMMNFSIDNPTVEKRGQESGGTIVGLPTTLYRYHTSYDFNMKVIGMKRANHIEMDQEIWATDALEAPGMGVWLRADRPTGFEGLDELIEAQTSTVQGFPLKTVTVTTTTGKKGKENTSRSTMEVTVLDRNRSIPDSTFEIPAGYQETQMMPMTGAQPADSEEGDDETKGKNPFKKIFGGG